MAAAATADEIDIGYGGQGNSYKTATSSPTRLPGTPAHTVRPVTGYSQYGQRGCHGDQGGSANTSLPR